MCHEWTKYRKRSLVEASEKRILPVRCPNDVRSASAYFDNDPVAEVVQFFSGNLTAD